jgi:hypothetical protein
MVQVTLMFPYISHVIVTNKHFKKSCNHKLYMMIFKKKIIWASCNPGFLLTNTHKIKFTLQLSVYVYLHYQIAVN